MEINKATSRQIVTCIYLKTSFHFFYNDIIIIGVILVSWARAWLFCSEIVQSCCCYCIFLSFPFFTIDAMGGLRYVYHFLIIEILRKCLPIFSSILFRTKGSDYIVGFIMFD